MDVKEVVREKLREVGMEEYLRQNGVDLKTIHESKGTVASRAGEKRYYYDKVGEQKDVLVPISEIKGINRVSGFTWFDILNYGATGVPESVSSQGFNINSNSFWGVLSWLEKNTLNDVKYMYMNTDNIEFKCLKKGDSKEYYLLGDGNHRIVTAKNIGIPLVISKNVEVYEYNEKKHNAYKLYQRKYKELDEMIDDLGLLSEPSFRKANQIVLDIDDRFEVLFTFTYEEDDLIYDFLRIDTMISEVDSLIERLYKIKKNSDMFYRVYKMFPEKLRRLVKKAIPFYVKDKGISHIIALNNVEKPLEEKNKI